jgi:hypothetical protein
VFVDVRKTKYYKVHGANLFNITGNFIILTSALTFTFLFTVTANTSIVAVRKPEVRETPARLVSGIL